MIVQVMSR